MNIVFLGPPGSGKGTQSSRLADELGVPHISTGDLIREEIAGGSALGQSIKATVASGDLISDEQLLSVLGKRLAQQDARHGFILDGTPRSADQARLLETQTPIDLAVLIEVPDAVVAERIGGRWICPTDHHEYNTKYAPPAHDGVCDLCGAVLTQRPDDTPEGVKHRLTVYHSETEPVIEHYRLDGRLVTVNGNQSIEKVFGDLKEAINTAVNK